MHHIVAPSYKRQSSALYYYQWHAIQKKYSYLGKKKDARMWSNREKDIPGNRNA